MDELSTQQATTYIWYIWRFDGLYPTTKFKWLYTCYAILVNLNCNVATPFCSIFNVLYLKDLALIMHNLQASPTLIIAMVKQLILFFNMKYLHKVNTYLKLLDARAARNEEEVKYLKNVIRQSKLITMTLMVAIFCSLSSYAIPGIFKRRLVVEGWIPFDWSASTQLYAIAFSWQFISSAFLCVQNTASDGYPPVFINVLKGHVHALNMRVSRIGKDSHMTLEENYDELNSCIDDHKNVIRLFKTIRRVISLTVMSQFIITAFVLCVSGIYFIIFNRGVSQMFSTLVYMAAILAESFPVCYFGNALMDETDKLTLAIYNCNWMDQSLKFRKNLIIFMQRAQQPSIIKAGGLANISLQTLIGIIRFSFSLFSMLSQIER